MALFFEYFLGGLECVGHSFAYIAYFVFSRDVWIRTQRAAVASMPSTDLDAHFPNLAAHLPVFRVSEVFRKNKKGVCYHPR